MIRVIIVCLVLSSCEQERKVNLVQKDNPIEIIKLAEKEISKIHGHERMINQRPYKAKLSNEIWEVRGTLSCGDNKFGDDKYDSNGNKTGKIFCKGGVSTVKISNESMSIISISHGK